MEERSKKQLKAYLAPEMVEYGDVLVLTGSS
jgi:hypothetical protein